MGYRQIPSSAQQLMRAAREQTDIDIVDRDIEERLEKLLLSLNAEAELHQAGAAGMERHIMRVLRNRLLMLRDFAAHPEINEQRIVRPLIIACLARTGSTKLHKMLASGGDFIDQKFWQGYNLSLRTGRRGEDPQPRIADAEAHVRWFNESSPQARLTHEFSTFETEEESQLFEYRLFAQYLGAYVYVPGYAQWYMAQDMRGDLAFLKQGLKYLQWQFPERAARPWVLKCPAYPGLEALLAEQFPDAAFVATHRDPTHILSSITSLLYHYSKAYSDVDRRRITSPMMLEGWAMLMDQSMAVRDSHPGLKILDIGYSEVTANAESVVEKVYAHVGMSLSDEARQAMLKWERENGQHKHGAHRHSLEDFFLTPETVRGRFAAYIERFGHCF